MIMWKCLSAIAPKLVRAMMFHQSDIGPNYEETQRTTPAWLVYFSGVLAEFSSLSRCISYVTLVLASSGPSCLAEGTSGNAFG